MPTAKKNTDKKSVAKTTKPTPATKKGGPAAKPAAPAVKRASAAKSPRADKAKAVAISAAEVASRAYFIAEARHREGRPGNAEGDWVAAERQLRAEASAAGKGRPAKPRAGK